jgi:hypothetical protein
VVARLTSIMMQIKVDIDGESIAQCMVRATYRFMDVSREIVRGILVIDREYGL